MTVNSIAVGLPRVVTWKGDEVRTSIFKTPVPGPVRAVRHNLEGDRQSDLQVHGGEFKAVYAYAAEHYAWWERPLEPARLYVFDRGDVETMSRLAAHERLDPAWREYFEDKLAGSSGVMAG